MRGEFQKAESEKGKPSECMGQIPAREKVTELRFELPPEMSLQCVQPRQLPTNTHTESEHISEESKEHRCDLHNIIFLMSTM